MTNPSLSMVAHCSMCGGAHRYVDPCPPKGEYSRMLESGEGVVFEMCRFVNTHEEADAWTTEVTVDWVKYLRGAASGS